MLDSLEIGFVSTLGSPLKTLLTIELLLDLWREDTREELEDLLTPDDTTEELVDL